MSFPYPPGTTVVPHTAFEHATDMLNNINAILLANNVRIGGVLVQLVPSYTNVVWLVLLAVGAIRAVYDNYLVAAGQMFSVSECSDDQMLACLPLSGTSLIPGAYSVATVRVTASGAGAAVIPDGASLPLGTVCNFVVPTGSGVTILASTYADIVVVADVIGPIEAGAGTLTAFSATYANVASVTNSAPAIVGRDAETVQGVRQRLLVGSIADTNIDGTARAILAISGITKCKVYFNWSKTTPLVLPGGTTLQPRQAYVLIVGTDPTGLAIAEAYARRMSADTYGGSSQTYTTLAGQAFPVNYDTAPFQDLYVTVYYDDTKPYAVGFADSIEQLVAAIVFDIGEQGSAAQVLQALAGFADATVVGAEVSVDDLAWDNIAVVDADKVGRYLAVNVHVVAET